MYVLWNNWYVLFFYLLNKIRRNKGGIMYEIEEFYKEDGYTLDEALKTCILNYFNKYMLNLNK